MVNTIGKVTDLSWKRDFEWKIEGFTKLSAEANKYYTSPLFYFADASWYLSIYPNGHKSKKSIGRVDMYLTRKSSGSPISLDYSLILKTMDEKTDQETDLSHVFEKADSGFGSIRLLKRSEFLERRTELGLPDVLTVICTMKKTESSGGDGVSEQLSCDLKEMMLNGDNRDTVINVKGEEFLVHRDMLVARNPYFNSMFKSDMKEVHTGVVSIDDCEPDVFRSFVHFIYTGRVDKLTVENVCDLYETADKYQEDHLKKECLHFMLKTLSVVTFCDYIVLALKYDEKELFKSAVDHFTSKPKEIVSSVKWQVFSKEYNTQANELIIKILDKHYK